MSDTRARQQSDLADLKAALASRSADLARALCPDGERSGHYWICPNPRDGSGKHKRNFWINLDGAKSPGSWHDPVAGEKGSPLDLIMLVEGRDFPSALKWARDFLGWEQMAPDERARARRNVAENAEAVAAREAKLLERNRGQAFALWLKASERLAATPVETYLRGRGIDLDRLPRPPNAVRFGVRRHLETGMTLPAMLALMTGPDPTGKKESTYYAVHCTFLANDGHDKAPVSPQRKMWPSFRGGAIRLARGETGMSPGEAAKQGLLDTLCLCEGVEDGLSIALACPELRVWAAGSLGNLRHQVLPACCAEVIVAADNDWGKPQAAAALEVAIEALSLQGRKVSVARSPIGKDANDALRGTGGGVWAVRGAMEGRA